ncbi:MAG: hypothetical protein WC238_05445 [Parcubacteria group bacterium]
MKTCKTEKLRGFSMLESMLAVFVLSIGIVGVMSLLVSSMKHSMDSRDTIIATELAQEGLELVRNVRDNNVASGEDAFKYFPAASGEICWIGISQGYPNLLTNLAGMCPSAGGEYRFGISSTSNFYGRYQPPANTLTKFSRKIVIENDAASGGKKITSAVSWNGGVPDDDPSTANCNAGSKCTFAQSILVAR